MAANLAFSPEMKNALASTICRHVSNGGHLGPVLKAVGIDQSTWWDWRQNDPEMAQAYARAQERYAESLVSVCPEIAMDKTEGWSAKDKRVIIDTNLKVAALLCPKRFSQAALDKAVAPEEEPVSARSAQEIAAELRRVYGVAKTLLPAPPVDAEFTEVEADA